MSSKTSKWENSGSSGECAFVPQSSGSEFSFSPHVGKVVKSVPLVMLTYSGVYGNYDLVRAWSSVIEIYRRGAMVTGSSTASVRIGRQMLALQA